MCSIYYLMNKDEPLLEYNLKTDVVTILPTIHEFNEMNIFKVLLKLKKKGILKSEDELVK